MRTRAALWPPNGYSLLQAAYQPERYPLAVYAGEEMVGFLMDPPDPDDAEWWIYRRMIDQRHQGRGYGREAMEQVIERIRRLPGCRRIFLGYEPENRAAEQLYARLGFRKTGEMRGGETVAVLTW